MIGLGLSLLVVFTLAHIQLRRSMEPLEALVAATAGGARALRLEDGRGRIREGAPADLLVWRTADHREIPYRFGEDLLAEVWKRGVRVA